MPVLSKCPLCRGAMPDARGEARCPRCGELVLPSVRKLCATCGSDVTHGKRVRDEAGEYYCHDCWTDKLAARGEEPGYVCSTCSRLFPSSGVYQDGDDIICMRCFQQRNLDPNTLLEEASHVGDDSPVVFEQRSTIKKPPAPKWLWVTIAVVAVLAGTVALLLLRK